MESGSRAAILGMGCVYGREHANHSQDATPRWKLGRDRVSWEWVACSGGNTQTIRKIPLLAGSRVVGGNLGNGLRVPVGRSVPRRSWEKSTSSDQWGNFEKNNFEKNKCWKATPRWKLGRGPLLDGNRVVAGEAGGLPGSFLPRNVRKMGAGKIFGLETKFFSCEKFV